MSKSMLDVAYDYFVSQNDVVHFGDVWDYVKQQLSLSEEEANKKLAKFYTNLLIDGRFVILSDDLWDLKSKHTFDEVHRDMGDVYSIEEDNESDLDDEDDDMSSNDENKSSDDSDEDESEEKNSNEDYY